MSTNSGTMSRFRFSISGLLALVALCGVMFAALRTHSGIWSLVMAMIVVSSLLIALLGVFFLRGPWRAFWAGFALFGGCFLYLFHWYWFLYHFGNAGISNLLDAASWYDPDTDRHGRMFDDTGVIIDDFVRIAWLEIVLVLALIGGIIGAVFAARAESRRVS